jgi:tetratricopeptide (TPR) repeat protein
MADPLTLFYQMTRSAEKAKEDIRKALDALSRTVSTAQDPTLPLIEARLRTDLAWIFTWFEQKNSLPLYTDTLQRLRTLNSKKDLGYCLLYFSQACLDLYDMDTARSAADECTRILSVSGDPWASAIAKTRLALCHERTDQFDDAIRLLKEAVQHLEACGDSWELIWAGQSLARNLFAARRIEESTKVLERTVDVCRKTIQFFSISIVYQNIGTLYLRMGQDEKGFEHIWTSIGMRRSSADHLSIITAITVIEEIMQMDRRHDDIRTFLTETLSHFEKKKEYVPVATCLSILGLLDVETERYEEAALNFQRGLSLTEAATHQNLWLALKTGEGYTAWKTGGKIKAIEAAAELTSVLGTPLPGDSAANMWSFLAEIEMEKKDFERALSYLRHFAGLLYNYPIFIHVCECLLVYSKYLAINGQSQTASQIATHLLEFPNLSSQRRKRAQDIAGNAVLSPSITPLTESPSTLRLKIHLKELMETR